MRKIPTVFVRDPVNPKTVTETVTPGCEWVFAGEGVPTVKHDGTAVLIRGGKPFKRFEVKAGKPTPPDFEPAQDAREDTGGTPGWIPVADTPDNKWHIEAWNHGGSTLSDGTYELMGPKVQGNPENLKDHVLWRHGADRILNLPSAITHASLAEYLRQMGALGTPIEGIVWHHLDGRMAKIKSRDFGLPWPPRKEPGETSAIDPELPKIVEELRRKFQSTTEALERERGETARLRELLVDETARRMHVEANSYNEGLEWEEAGEMAKNGNKLVAGRLAEIRELAREHLASRLSTTPH